LGKFSPIAPNTFTLGYSYDNLAQIFGPRYSTAKVVLYFLQKNGFGYFEKKTLLVTLLTLPPIFRLNQLKRHCPHSRSGLPDGLFSNQKTQFG
jgi:hypothetical protein